MSLSTESSLRTLFLTEGVLKVIGGAIFVFSPSSVLKSLTFAPYSVTSEALVRNFGTQTLAFSIPLFLAARSDTASVKSRKLVYWTLLAREGLLALGLLAQIGASYVRQRFETANEEVDIGAIEEGRAGTVRELREDKMVGSTKLKGGMWLWVAELTPFVVGRLWILTKSDWF